MDNKIINIPVKNPFSGKQNQLNNRRIYLFAECSARAWGSGHVLLIEN